MSRKYAAIAALLFFVLCPQPALCDVRVFDKFSKLLDTNISSPTEGQVPRFNATSGKWENVDLPAGVVDGQQLFDSGHVLSLDAGARKLYAWDGVTVILDWEDPSTAAISRFGNPSVSAQQILRRNAANTDYEFANQTIEQDGTSNATDIHAPSYSQPLLINGLEIDPIPTPSSSELHINDQTVLWVKHSITLETDGSPGPREINIGAGGTLGSAAFSSAATLLARANHTGTQAESTITNLTSDLAAKVTGNTAITGATKTKVTYDSKGLVTAGADATTADIADSIDKRYVTDAQRTVIGNTSGMNTGDQTISDATISTTDITTNDVSTTKHGFAPKAPNDATKFLNGVGAYAVPAGSGGDFSSNTSTSVDGEVVLFSGTTGKTGKRATGTGLAKLTSGVPSTVTAPSGTVVGDTDAQALSNKTITLAAGTSSLAPITLTSGTNLTSVAAGSLEFDGGAFYRTVDTTNGRTQDANQQIYRLTADQSAVGPAIADFFPTGSAIPTVTNGVYEIVWYLNFTKTTTGNVTYTITNTQTYTNLVASFQQGPIAGISSGATASPMQAGIVATTTAAAALPNTSSMTGGTNHQAIVRCIAECGPAGNIRLRVTQSAGTITPLRGSYFTVRRLAAGNVGTFAN